MNSTFNCQRNNNNRAHTQGLNEIVNTSWRKTVDIDLYIYIYVTLLSKTLLNKDLPEQIVNSYQHDLGSSIHMNNSVFFGILSEYKLTIQIWIQVLGEVKSFFVLSNCAASLLQLSIWDDFHLDYPWFSTSKRQRVQTGKHASQLRVQQCMIFIPLLWELVSKKIYIKPRKINWRFMGLLCFKKEKKVATNLLRYSRLSGLVFSRFQECFLR